MSVISRLIDRFRKAQPLDEASRGRVASEDDFWWIGGANDDASVDGSSTLSTRGDFSGIKELIKNSSTSKVGNDSSDVIADSGSNTTDILFDKSFESDGGGGGADSALLNEGVSLTLLSVNATSVGVIKIGTSDNRSQDEDINTSMGKNNASIENVYNESVLNLSEENLDSYATNLLKQCDILLENFRSTTNNSALRSSDDASLSSSQGKVAAVELLQPRAFVASSWASTAEQAVEFYGGLSVDSSLSDYTFAYTNINSVDFAEPAALCDEPENEYVPMDVEEEGEGYVLVGAEALVQSTDSERSVFRHLDMSAATGDASASAYSNNQSGLSSNHNDTNTGASSYSASRIRSGANDEPSRATDLEDEIEFVSLINEIINSISDRITHSNHSGGSGAHSNILTSSSPAGVQAATAADPQGGDDFADDYDNSVVTDIIDDILRSTFYDRPCPVAPVTTAAAVPPPVPARAPPIVDPIDKLSGFDAGSLLTTEAIRMLWSRINI